MSVRWAARRASRRYGHYAEVELPFTAVADYEHWITRLQLCQPATC